MDNIPPYILPPTEERTVAAGGEELSKKAVSGGSGGTEKQKRKSKGSTIATVHGRRTMKAYPVTEEELHNLFGLGLLAAICFSVGVELLKFGIDIYKDLQINQGIPQKTLDYWNMIEDRCWYGGGFLLILVIIFVYLGLTKIGKIKKDTDFGDY